jgi:transcription antitermination factor NusG
MSSGSSSLGCEGHQARIAPGLSAHAQSCWFAIHTYARHEKRVASELSHKGIEVYLPLLVKRHQWSDRQKLVELPLFPCYAFARLQPSAAARVKLLQTGGVLGLVGAAGQGEPIPDSQIENVRMLLTNKILLDPYHFLKVGQRVRVRGGSLDGLEGILVRRNGNRRLVISVESLERSLAISVEGLEVEPI